MKKGRGQKVKGSSRTRRRRRTSAKGRPPKDATLGSRDQTTISKQATQVSITGGQKSFLDQVLTAALGQNTPSGNNWNFKLVLHNHMCILYITT